MKQGLLNMLNKIEDVKIFCFKTISATQDGPLQWKWTWIMRIQHRLTFFFLDTQARLSNLEEAVADAKSKVSDFPLFYPSPILISACEGQEELFRELWEVSGVGEGGSPNMGAQRLPHV
jgi:hypothetical protein